MITKETGMFCLNSTITRQDENTVLVGRGNINTKEHVIRIEIAQDSA